tara:strand:+ start:251 stop:814 length:564 start_codon:yes stop_codon:yes gene_type:complete
MSAIELIFHFALYIVPSIVFFGAVYYVTNKWVGVQREKTKLAFVEKKETKKAPADLKKHFFPLQVEAYQRMVLFLERIAPNNMIMRLNNPGLPAMAFQQKLIDSVRQEYEHNLAQQIFISLEAWERVESSKDEILKIINMAGSKMPATALSNDLSKGVFEITTQLQSQPTDQAIHFLKIELNNLIGD